TWRMVSTCISLMEPMVHMAPSVRLAFQGAEKARVSQDLFEVDGSNTLMGTVFLLPFVLGVTVTMLLVRSAGSWGDRGPRPGGGLNRVRTGSTVVPRRSG